MNRACTIKFLKTGTRENSEHSEKTLYLPGKPGKLGIIRIKEANRPYPYL